MPSPVVARCEDGIRPCHIAFHAVDIAGDVRQEIGLVMTMAEATFMALGYFAGLSSPSVVDTMATLIFADFKTGGHTRLPTFSMNRRLIPRVRTLQGVGTMAASR